MHHSAHNEHWLVSGLVEGEVVVWDSLRVSGSPAVRRQLAVLYSDVAGDGDGVVSVRHTYPILQKGGAVCGFLAAAFLIDYAQGLMPHRRVYVQETAKSAVLHILRTGTIKVRHLCRCSERTSYGELVFVSQ